MLPALNLAAWSVGHTDLSADIDRSVKGSLRVAKQDLDAWRYRVPNVMDLDLLKVSCRLNERPTTVYGKFLWPVKAMLEAVGQGEGGKPREWLQATWRCSAICGAKHAEAGRDLVGMSLSSAQSTIFGNACLVSVEQFGSVLLAVFKPYAGRAYSRPVQFRHQSNDEALTA